MPPTTKSTTAKLLSFTETVGGAGCARVRCSRRRLAASCSRHRRCCRRATKRRSTYCSSDGENAAVPTCGAALRVLIIQEVTVFASPFASPSPSSLFYHRIHVFTLGANQRRHGRQRDINSSKPWQAGSVVTVWEPPEGPSSEAKTTPARRR